VCRRNRDDRGVVARSDDHLLGVVVERRQQVTGGTVRTVFTPEVLEQGGLGACRLSPELRLDQVAVRVVERHSRSCSRVGGICVSISTFV
jgi:hypothetical protein